ncbi:hypothetical protein, partial [Nisaea sp.]|uniref:hypothetical protein n=1 Tax=Nisaea sp. TaxID=2024842 RepID=UPI003296D1EA
AARASPARVIRPCETSVRTFSIVSMAGEVSHRNVLANGTYHIECDEPSSRAKPWSWDRRVGYDGMGKVVDALGLEPRTR